MKYSALLLSLFLLLSACSEESSEKKEDASEPKTVENEETSDIDMLDKGIIKQSEDPIEPVDEKAIQNEELEVYLDDPDTTGTNIRKSPNGELFMTLVKDEVNIEYFLTVIDFEHGWFKIKSPIGGMENDIHFKSEEVWIHGSVISVDTRNYGGQTIEMYGSPLNGEVVGTITEEVGGLKIKDMHGKWVQIEYNGVTGWVDNEWLCGNPLTTCS